MNQHIPDRPNFEHPDVAGETQRWCNVCERDAEDCICSDLVRSSESVEAGMQGDRQRFYCEKCGASFDEIGGKRYRDGDVFQWCPKCGASDDFITDNDDESCPGCGVESGQRHQRGCREIGYTPSQPEQKPKPQPKWKCVSSEDHEYDICTDPNDSRLGKLICKFCGEPAPGQSEPETQPAVNVGAGRDVPADAEEGLSTWINEVERNQLQNKRDAQEREWARQVQLQTETDA